MRSWVISSLFALAVGCDNSSGVPSLPTASPSVGGTAATPFPFNAGAGVFIGTLGFENIVVTNVGSQVMSVTSVTYTPTQAGDRTITLGDPYAKLPDGGPAPISGVSLASNPDGGIPVPPPAVAVSYNDALVVLLTCKPTAATTVTGTVDIKSNASNLPDISIVTSCLGVEPDAGT